MDHVKKPSSTYLKFYAVLGALLFSVIDLGLGLRGGVAFYGASGLGLGALLGSAVDRRATANHSGVGWTHRAVSLTGALLAIALSGWAVYFWFWGAREAKGLFFDFSSPLSWLTILTLNVPCLPLVSSLVALGIVAASIKLPSRLLLIGAIGVLAGSTCIVLSPFYSAFRLINSEFPAPQ